MGVFLGAGFVVVQGAFYFFHKIFIHLLVDLSVVLQGWTLWFDWGGGDLYQFPILNMYQLLAVSVVLGVDPVI